MQEIVERVLITQDAAEVVRSLQLQYGPLLFHQSGGCCDGSAPMCFQQGDFRIGESDVLVGRIEDCPFYMHIDQFLYWQHTQLTVDITRGRGSSFSLEIPLGLRFVIRSRVFSDMELPMVRSVSGAREW